MKEKAMTRRELLQSSAAVSLMAAVPLAIGGLSGCNSRRASSIRQSNWRELSVPARSGSFSPRVSGRSDGRLILSWLEPADKNIASLRFSILGNGGWSEPATVAEGRPFSRDRAAAPGIIGLSSKNLIAYWSQRVPSGEHERNEIELYMATSTDDGGHWTEPALVNRAAAQPGEDNGYASAAELNETDATLIWLDGRNWETEKRVALMVRTVRTDRTMNETSLLDGDTCTCCSTAIVKTSSGSIAAYRGHTAENIRDISTTRTVAGSWSQPRVVHADHWHIEACPVNGPHLAADGDRITLIWFSAANDKPEVKLARSANGGADFSAPVRVDQGNAIGRAQVVLLPDGSAIAIWLENSRGTARLLARMVRDDGALEGILELAKGADLGYPHAARAAGGVLVTWADRNAVSTVHAGLLRIA